MAAKVRLYVEHPLGAGQTVPLTAAQAHYLFGVMRLAAGDTVALFNGRDGEWQAEVAEAGRQARRHPGAARSETAPQALPPDLWLLFAPIKKARTDFIVEKAVEMGAARILPVQTDFTNSERIRQRPAAGPCGRGGGAMRRHLRARGGGACPARPAAGGLAGSPPADVLRRGAGRARRRACADAARGDPWAILIGPEGGFSAAERDRLRGLPFAHAVGLGPRILRADTAAVAALTLWQARLGDWR